MMQLLKVIFCLWLMLAGVVGSITHSIVPAVSSFREIDRKGIGIINHLDIHPNNQMVAVGTSTGIYLYDLPALTQLSNFDFYNRPVSDVAWSPNGKYLAYAGEGVYIWNSSEKKTERLFDKPIHKLAWSADGQQLFGIGGNDAGDLAVYQWVMSGTHFSLVRSYVIPSPLPNAYPKITHFVWVDDYLVASIHYSGNNGDIVMAWMESTHQTVYQSPQDGIISFALSPDRKTILLGEYGTDRIYSLELGTFQLRQVFRGEQPDQIFWSADGKKIFIGLILQIYSAINWVKVVNISNWKEEDFFSPENNFHGIGGLTSDGKYVLGIYDYMLGTSPIRHGDIISEGLILYRLPDWKIQQMSPAQQFHRPSNESLIESGPYVLPGTRLQIDIDSMRDKYQVSDLTTGNIIGQLPSDLLLFAYSPKNGLLATTTDFQTNDIEIWMVTPEGIYPKPIVTLHGHTTTYYDETTWGGIDDLYWQDDQLISIGGDGTIRTWSVPTSATAAPSPR